MNIELSPAQVATYYAARLPALKQTKAQWWRGQCPLHKGDRDSFAVNAGSGAWKCHSKCGRGGDVVAIEMLLEGVKFAKARDNVRALLGLPPDGAWRVAAAYSYRDQDGEELYQALREERDGDKRFRYRRQVNGGWDYKLGDVRRVLYGLQRLRQAKPQDVIWIAEGEKCVEALAAWKLVAVSNPGGAGKWRDNLGGVELLAGRHVAILPDNDEPGRNHAIDVATKLLKRAATVRIVELPNLPVKGDVADFAQAGGTKDALLKQLDAAAPLTIPLIVGLVNRWNPVKPSGASAVTASAPPSMTRPEDAPTAKPTYAGVAYQEDPQGLLYWSRRPDGGVKDNWLTNFTARITEELVIDNGVEIQRALKMRAKLNGRPHVEFQVSASEFDNITSWAVPKIGAGAIVHPGQREHTRAAIQSLSQHDLKTSYIYKHTGWRKRDAEWMYLHGGGALTAAGNELGVKVDLGGVMNRYQFPDAALPPAELRKACDASIRLLDLHPRIAAVWASIWRAPLGRSDFSLFLHGTTGSGKSELAAMCQAHYGAGFDSRSLPANWSNTAGSLEALASSARDALLVIDEFVPGGSGSRKNIDDLNAKAEYVFRSVGNHQSRGRLNSDLSMRADRTPEAFVLATGEDMPRHPSVRARLLLVEIRKAQLRFDLLSRCQSDAAAGLYSGLMAAYIQWLAPQLADVRASLREGLDRARKEQPGVAVHRRTYDNIAQVRIGARWFLNFCLDRKLMPARRVDDLWAQIKQETEATALAQARHQETADPARMYLDLVRAAITSGSAHVAGTREAAPPEPETWGWRSEGRDRFVGRGALIGWADDDNLYLDPHASYSAAQAAGQAAGEHIAVQLTTLPRRLAEAKLLLTTDKPRQTLTVRRRLGGVQRNVLHFSPDSLWGGEKPDKPDMDANGAPVDPEMSGFNVGLEGGNSRSRHEDSYAFSTR